MIVIPDLGRGSKLTFSARSGSYERPRLEVVACGAGRRALNAKGRAVVCTPPARQALAPPGVRTLVLAPDVLGHLLHQIQPQCPQQLGMVVREMSLGRIEDFLL